MKPPLRILHLEDSRRDAELIRFTLEEEGLDCEVLHVKNKEEFEAAITNEIFDVVLSDFALPHYNGLTALDVVRSKAPTVPFILLSGTVGEEVAVQSLKTGATDYILKQKPVRLVPAIRRALEEAQERVRREQAEEALRKSEERFQFAARATNDVIWDWDLLTNDLWLSESFNTVFGYRAEEIQPRIESWISRLHPDDRERVLSGLHAFGESGDKVWSDEYRFRRGDGTYAHVLDRAYVIHDATGKSARMIGARMDITSRKQSEAQVREQAALLDKAQDAICVTDMEQQILYWNKSAERLYGWSSAEALGKNAHKLLQRDPNLPLQAMEVLIRKNEWQGELEQVTKSRNKLTVESRWTLVRNASGEPKSMLVINTDITERKQIEAQFLRTQRMESIGALAGGIAHDLNNMLSPILIAVDLLRASQSNENKEILEMVGTSAQRGADMVKQILSFARGASGEHGSTDVKHIIKDMARLAKETFPRSIRIEDSIAANLWCVTGNSTQLHQVLLNLCVNARDAMNADGVLMISADNVNLDGVISRWKNEPVTGQYVRLKVSDSGHGISPEVMGKIFDPFFTTKEAGKGTGLGLSTTMGIVKHHGGFMDLRSEVGKGTIFTVYLPASNANESEMTEHAGEMPNGHGEEILLIDDEVALVEMTRLMLEAHNYRVLTAMDGAAAVRMYGEHRDAIQLVMTDMMMPIMDGSATIRELQKINPAVKIVSMSGLGSSAFHSSVNGLHVAACLKKPYATEDLLKTIRNVLEMNLAA